MDGGGDNVVERLDQDGNGNTADILLSGLGNGDGVFIPSGRADGAFGGLVQSFVSQNGSDNTLGFSASENGNLFAFRQDGSDGYIDAMLDGNDNAIGVEQFYDAIWR